MNIDSLRIEYVGNFNRTGTLSIYELENAANPWTIYMDLQYDASSVIAGDGMLDDKIPTNSLGKVNLQSDAEFAASLPEAKHRMHGTFRINKYRLLAKELGDITNIYAHYGMIRSGGRLFNITECKAATNDKFLYEVEFYTLDVQQAFAVYKSLLTGYTLTQQISFDIATYDTSNRRTSLQVVRRTNLYPKLNVHMSLTGNDMLIVCKDTNGIYAAKHIAQSLGIAEESISMTVHVIVSGMNAAGETSQQYNVVVANPDYSDQPMHVILPKLANDILAAQVDIDYIMQLQTIGETLHLYSSMTMTDEQIANLHPLTATEIADGIAIGWKLLSKENEPIEGVNISVNGQTVTTNSLGLASIKLSPGSYIAIIEYQDVVKQVPLTASAAQVITIVLDIVMLDMEITVIGSDAYALPNIELDVNNVKRVTDKNGVVVLRGIEGRVFHVTHKLGQVLHDEAFTMDGQKKVMKLYNTFNEEIMFSDELT